MSLMFPKPVKEKKKKKRFNPIGKKTREWEAAKRILKPAYAEAGIVSCELAPVLERRGFDISKHRHWFFLTWAHGDKRKQLVGDELLTLVVLGCVDCHDFIEVMTRAEMRSIVEEAISRRRVQPVLK